MKCLRPAPGGTLIEIKAKPKSSKPGPAGVEDGALTVRLSSPPAEGAANAELVSILAKILKVPKTSIQIERGETARKKLLLVRGMEPADVEERLSKALK